MRFSKKMTLITAASVAGVLAIGGGAYAAFAPRDDSLILATSDVTEIQVRDVEEKVHAAGEVEAHRSTSLTSHLTGPVKDLKVALGDHVNAEQLLANMDTSAIERQLELEQANRAAAATTHKNQLATAQQQYDQLRQQFDQGLSPEITTAESAEHQALSAKQAAQTAFDDKRGDILAAADPALVEQESALKLARDEQRDAALNLLRVNAGTIFGVINGAAEPGMIVDAAATQNRVDRADRDLADKQRAYDRSLVQVNRELAELQAKVRDTNQAHTDAVVALEGARLSALQKIDAQRLAVEQANSAAATGTLASEVTSKHLTMDVSKAEIRSPHGGIVTELNAKVGAPAEGVLMTVADDSSLKVKTQVAEGEVAQVKPGTPVKFTTPAVKNRTFTGIVSHVAPVAKPQADPGKGKREFPVEVKVTGSTEGLKLGGSAKVELIVEQQRGALVVPRESVMKSPEGLYVIALVPENDKFRVKKVPVTVSAQTEFDAAIVSAELHEGDKVVGDPGKYAEDVDKLARVKEQG